MRYIAFGILIFVITSCDDGAILKKIEEMEKQQAGQIRGIDHATFCSQFQSPMPGTKEGYEPPVETARRTRYFLECK